MNQESTGNKTTFHSRQLVFNCKYLLIANCEFYLRSQLIDSQTKTCSYTTIRYRVNNRNYWIRNLAWWTMYLDQLLSYFILGGKLLYNLPWSCRLPQHHKSVQHRLLKHLCIRVAGVCMCVCVCVCVCARACTHVCMCAQWFAHHVWSHCQNMIIIHCVYLLVSW